MRSTTRFLTFVFSMLLAGSLLAATQNMDDVRNKIMDKTSIQNLQIQSSDGSIYLLGTAHILKDKLKAEDIARHQLGSKVVNNITVESTQRSDQEITVDVVANIRRKTPDRYLFNNMSVETHNGNVILTGQLRDAYLTDDAVEAAAEIPGVQSVTNNIQLLPVSPSDDRLRIAILRNFYRNGTLVNYLNGAEPSISIIVNASRVTLQGVVNSNVARTVAESIVRQTPGVLNVNNQIQVQ